MVSKTTIIKFNLNIQLNCLQSTKRYKKVYLLKIRELKQKYLGGREILFEWMNQRRLLERGGDCKG